MIPYDELIKENNELRNKVVDLTSAVSHFEQTLLEFQKALKLVKVESEDLE